MKRNKDESDEIDNVMTDDGNKDDEASYPTAFKQFTLDLGTIVFALNIWGLDSDAWEIIADVRKFIDDLWVQAKVVVISMKTRNHKGHDGGVRDQTQDSFVEAFSSGQNRKKKYLTKMKDMGREIRQIINGLGKYVPVNEQQDFRSGSWMPIRVASKPYALGKRSYRWSRADGLRLLYGFLRPYVLIKATIYTLNLISVDKIEFHFYNCASRIILYQLPHVRQNVAE
nr:cation-chloride cotransporter 1 isoform X5 [Tanacetum cinerariifolium]